MQLCASRTVLSVLCLSSLFAASLQTASAEESAAPKPTAEWYFWNEITGETQWEAPGVVPLGGDGAVTHPADPPPPPPLFALALPPQGPAPPTLPRLRVPSDDLLTVQRSTPAPQAASELPALLDAAACASMRQLILSTAGGHDGDGMICLHVSQRRAAHICNPGALTRARVQSRT